MFDFAIIGGGIVGASTAWQLSKRNPGARLVLIEKERQAAAHQTGRNSGVIHAGIYYTPGSLKARFCKAGVEATIGFCEEHGIPYEQPGKLVVATSDLELERLEALYARAQENGLTVSWLDEQAFREREPKVTGIAAIRQLARRRITAVPFCRRSFREPRSVAPDASAVDLEVIAIRASSPIFKIPDWTKGCNASNWISSSNSMPKN